MFFFNTLFFQTCKPDDDIGKTYSPYTLGEARDYLDFKPGSRWVYQNNKSGLFDTLVLKSISIKSQTFTGKNTVIKDMVNMLIYGTTTKYEYKYYTWGANPDAKKEYLDKSYFPSQPSLAPKGSAGRRTRRLNHHRRVHFPFTCPNK